MSQSLKSLDVSPQLSSRPPLSFPLPRHTSIIYHPLPSPKPHFKFSRRELAIRSNSLLLSLFSSQTLLGLLSHHWKAKAQENVLEAIHNGEEEEREKKTSNDISVSCSGQKTWTKRAFLDVTIGGQPAGRIIVGLYGDSSPVGAARFSELVSGGSGISYKKKEFTKIMPNYVQHGGVRSYGVDAELAQRGGRNFSEAQRLIEEWDGASGRCPAGANKSIAGDVSLIVRDPSRPRPRPKLIARNGRLEIDEEELKAAPNGTEFALSIKDSPELVESALVVGRVLEGMDVVQRIGQVKTVQDNTASPFFRVAKLVGDKRAVVAERSFNRPYSKVVITNCGLLE